MFRTTMCPLSGEITVSIRHLELVTLYGWLVCRVHTRQSSIQLVTLYGWLVCRVHTRQSSIQSDKYQVSHRYSCFFWWLAHSRSKHVEKRNKHTKENCARSWLYLQGPCEGWWYCSCRIIVKNLYVTVMKRVNAVEEPKWTINLVRPVGVLNRSCRFLILGDERILFSLYVETCSN